MKLNNYILDGDKGKILIIDDDITFMHTLKRILILNGFNIYEASNGKLGIEILEKEEIDIVLLDLILPDINGLELLEKIKKNYLNVEVIMITGFGKIDTAVLAVKSGAYDFLTKPFDNIDSVVLTISKAYEHIKLVRHTKKLEATLEIKEKYGELIGISSKIQSIVKIIDSIANSESSVLIQGESGTGKELVARSIHYKSQRKDKIFVPINCAAIPDSLIESELFGHIKGSFTGAVNDQKGVFEISDKGTIFLDEIGELSPLVQVKLLRVLQEYEIKRIGDTNPIKVDVRIIAATNKELYQEMKNGRFREDLFYRINVIVINIPPLRERKDDIPILTQYFLKKFSLKLGKEITTVTPDAIEVLSKYNWPGNVRELENVVERAIIFTNKDYLDNKDFEYLLEKNTIIDIQMTNNIIGKNFKEAKKEAINEFEKTYLFTLLDKYNGNITKAAKHAKLDRSNFRKLLKKYK